MKTANYRRISLALLLFGLGLLALLYPLPSQAQEATPDVVVLNLRGAVSSAMRDYFERGINVAEETGADAVLILLDTPGGQISIMQEIIQIIRRAEIPIILYVGPPGAQAASAGSFIVAAGHASGMAPDTTIGAASPISSTGEDIQETLDLKVREDLKATVRTLLADRGEEAVALGERMVDEATAVNADEALAAGFIDAIAQDTDRLFASLDGLQVEVLGVERTLRLENARQRSLDPNTFEVILHLLTNPNVVALLLAIALPAILVEIRSPGGWVAGFVGVVALILGLYGAGQLPVNWLGLGLMIVAFVLLAMEATTPSVGALAITGSITLVAGLLVLFNSPGSPAFARIRTGTALGIALPNAIFFLWIASLAFKAQRQAPQTGGEAMMGKSGLVRSKISPRGMVLVNGELWQARAEETLESGTDVIVEGRDGFTLQVRRKTPSEPDAT